MISAVLRPIGNLLTQAQSGLGYLRDGAVRIARFANETFRSLFMSGIDEIPSASLRTRSIVVTQPSQPTDQEGDEQPGSTHPISATASTSGLLERRGRGGSTGNLQALTLPEKTAAGGAAAKGTVFDFEVSEGDEDEEEDTGTTPSDMLLSPSTAGDEIGALMIGNRPLLPQAAAQEPRWPGERFVAKVTAKSDRQAESLKDKLGEQSVMAALGLCISGKLNPGELKNTLHYHLQNPRASTCNYKVDQCPIKAEVEDGTTAQAAMENFFNRLLDTFRKMAADVALGNVESSAILFTKGNRRKKEHFVALAQGKWLWIFDLRIEPKKRMTVAEGFERAAKPLTEFNTEKSYFSAKAGVAVEERDSPEQLLSQRVEEEFTLTASKAPIGQVEAVAHWLIDVRYRSQEGSQIGGEFLKVASITSEMPGLGESFCVVAEG